MDKEDISLFYFTSKIVDENGKPIVYNDEIRVFVKRK
jgi:hypothetical protein